MANTSQAPDLEGLHCEIHGMAEQMRVMNENNNTRLLRPLAVANPPPSAVSPIPDIEQSHRFRRSGDNHSQNLRVEGEKVRRGRSPCRNDQTRHRNMSTSQKIRDLDARLDAINTRVVVPIIVDALIRQTEPPFTERLLRAIVSSRFKLPTQLRIYKGKTDPMDHLDSYKSLMSLQGCSDEVMQAFFYHPKGVGEIMSKADKYIAAKELVEAKHRRRGKEDHKRKEPDIRRPDYREETRSKKSDQGSKLTNERRPRTLPRRPELILPPLKAPIA
ncbi:hypothetical protein Acr_12g0004110 [Actinidia rufa]|uniref:Uncharacterized protein n=1 Tax=Actinidia rufa TaxID=165716 RepID=A0A7J0FGQ8_9ERIC|nr:hypothetical protein Acr_12g0004110 [Actinidia rufa]